MKKFLAVMVCILTLLSVFSVVTYASEEENPLPYLSNPCKTNTNFVIDANGNAKTTALLEVYDDGMISATIKTKIQKRFLFFFWQDVTEWIDETDENSYLASHSITVDSGTYKAIVEYTIRGTGGDPDVITDEIERTH